MYLWIPEGMSYTISGVCMAVCACDLEKMREKFFLIIGMKVSGEKYIHIRIFLKLVMLVPEVIGVQVD